MRKVILVFFLLFQSFGCFPIVKINLFVFFRFDKYDVGSEYKNQIDSVIRKYKIKQIFIKAYCDSFGSNEYNDALSLKRANAVKQYLVSQNMDARIMDIQAFGKRFSENNNESAKARALNRRAEITFIADDYPLNKVDSVPESIALPNDSFADSDTLTNDTSAFSINNIEVGKTFVLENLNFYGGRHVLLPKSHPILKRLLNTLQANPTLAIEIQGHICCIQSGEDGRDIDTYTSNLSVNRARAIYDYLVKNGIDPSRLSYKGFGSRYKLVREITEADRSTNRRVEIKVLKK
jgi:outer membrane protein OmpA-like peptidoglycan-associated protein